MKSITIAITLLLSLNVLISSAEENYLFMKCDHSGGSFSFFSENEYLVEQSFNGQTPSFRLVYYNVSDSKSTKFYISMEYEKISESAFIEDSDDHDVFSIPLSSMVFHVSCFSSNSTNFTGSFDGSIIRNLNLLRTQISGNSFECIVFSTQLPNNATLQFFNFIYWNSTVIPDFYFFSGSSIIDNSDGDLKLPTGSLQTSIFISNWHNITSDGRPKLTNKLSTSISALDLSASYYADDGNIAKEVTLPAPLCTFLLEISELALITNASYNETTDAKKIDIRNSRLSISPPEAESRLYFPILFGPSEILIYNSAIIIQRAVASRLLILAVIIVGSLAGLTFFGGVLFLILYRKKLTTFPKYQPAIVIDETNNDLNWSSDEDEDEQNHQILQDDK